MFHSFVTKFRPGANERSRLSGIEDHVGAEPHPGDLRVAQRVRAIQRDHVQRIDPVAKRFRHLAVLRVAHDAVQQHRVERRAPVEMQPRHDHASDPEEQNVGHR